MSPDERVRRLVDGELTDAEAMALEADAASDAALARALDDARYLAAHLSALAAETEVEPPGDLVERSVRAAVAAREAEKSLRGPARWLSLLTEPRVVRLRIVPSAVAGPLLAAAVVLLVLAGRPGSRGGPAHPAPDVRASSASSSAPPIATAAAGPSASEPARVPVRFVLPAGGAHTVAVAGDFNGWDPSATELRDSGDNGIFVGTLSLRAGDYAYMFVVDGQRWVTDPYATNFRDDGFGHRNAVLRIE